MQTLILARHGTSRSNLDDAISCTPPGLGLGDRGVDEALALGEQLREESIDLGVCSELLRTRETLALALGARDTPTLTLPTWNEIHFGRYEGGPLAPYRDWAWTAPADVDCPGGGDSRGAVAQRVAETLRTLLARPEHTVLAVGHALPVRYVLDAAVGLAPTPRITPVPHATAHRLDRAAAERAAGLLEEWAAAPRFSSRGD